MVGEGLSKGRQWPDNLVRLRRPEQELEFIACDGNSPEGCNMGERLDSIYILKDSVLGHGPGRHQDPLEHLFKTQVPVSASPAASESLGPAREYAFNEHL